MRREYHILDRAFDQMVLRAKADKIAHRTAAMGDRRRKGPRRQEHAGGCFRDHRARSRRRLGQRYRGLARFAYQTLVSRASPAWRDSGDGAERVLFTLDNMTLELMAPAGNDATRGADSQRRC